MIATVLTILFIIIFGSLTTGLVFGLIYFIDLFIDWNIGRSDKLKIKLKQFKRFYNMNPKAWRLKDSYVIYEVFNGYDGKATFKFYFPFLDFIRYIIFKKGIEKKSAQVKYTESYLEALEYIKKDIEKFTEQNNKFVEEKIQMLQNTKR